MAIINNLVMEINGQNIVVYPNTVGRAVYINESNGYNLIQALEDLRNNSTSEWRDVKNKPFNLIGTDFKVVDGKLQLNGSFSMEWDTIQNKPTVFNSSWGRITGKPTMYPSDWNVITNKPTIYNSNWVSVENKPNIYQTNWNSIEEKPEFFESEWFTVNNKPFNLLNTNYFYVDETEQQNKLSILQNIFVPLYDEYKNKEIEINNIPYLYYNSNQSFNGGTATRMLPHLMNIQFVGGTYAADDDIKYYVANGLGINVKYLFVDVNNRPVENVVRYYYLPENSSYFFSIKGNGISGSGWSISYDNNVKNNSILDVFDYNYVINASHMYEKSFVRNMSLNKYRFLNGKNFNNFYYLCPQMESFSHIDIQGDFTGCDINNIICGVPDTVIGDFQIHNFIYDSGSGYNVPAVTFISNLKQRSDASYADSFFSNIFISNCIFLLKNCNIQNLMLSQNVRLSNTKFLSGFTQYSRLIFYELNLNIDYNTNFIPQSTIPDGYLNINDGYSTSNISFPMKLLTRGWMPYTNSIFITRANAQYPFVYSYSFGSLCFNVHNVSTFANNINNINILLNGASFVFTNCGSILNIEGFGNATRIYLNESQTPYFHFYSDKQAQTFNFSLSYFRANFYNRLWGTKLSDSYFNFYDFTNIGQLDLTCQTINNINNLYFQFVNSYLSTNMVLQTSIDTKKVAIFNGFSRVQRLGMQWTDYTTQHSVQVNSITFAQDNFYQLSEISLFQGRWSDYYQDITSNINIYLPDETPYNRSTSISEYGIFHYNAERVRDYRKNFFIHGDTDLDNRWQNVKLALNDFFNITDENIINQEQCVPMTNGYYYPNFNLYIYNNTKSTLVFVNRLPLNHLSAEFESIEHIKFTNQLPDDLTDPSKYIIYAPYTYNTSLTNAFFNKTDNTYYLYKPDNVQILYDGFGMQFFSSEGMYYLLNYNNTLPNKDELVDIMNNITFINGTTYSSGPMINSLSSINNSFKLDNVTNIPWLYSNSQVKNIYIPNSAVNIFQMYYNCQYITEAQCPESIIDFAMAYMYCNNISTGVVGPKVVNSYQAYGWCNNLREAEIIGNEAQLDCTFKFCNKLTGSFTFDNYIGNMNSPFYGSAVSEIKLKGKNTKSQMNNILGYMTNLSSLEMDLCFLGNYNSTSCPSFYQIARQNDYLPKLEYIIINDDYEPEAKNWHWTYGSAFAQCNPYMPLIVYTPGMGLNATFNYACFLGESAPNVVVGGFVGNYYTNNDYLHYSYQNTIGPNTAIFAIGNFINTPGTSWSNSSWVNNCNNLVMLTLPEHWGTNAPYYSSGINIGSSGGAPFSLVYGVLPYSNPWVNISNSYYNVQYTYNSCPNLLIPSLLDDYNNFAMCGMYYAYSGCSNLVIAIGPSGRYGSYKNIDSSYGGCSNLRIIIAGTYNSINIYNSFSGCWNIKKLYGNFNNIYMSFNGSSTGPELRNEDFYLKANNICYSFQGFGNFRNITLEANNIWNVGSGGFCYDTLYISSGNIQSGFNGISCKNLIINLYECNTGYENRIGLDNCFCGLSNLVNLDISVNCYTINNLSYGMSGQAFWSTPNLTNVNFYNVYVAPECNNNQIFPIIMNAIRLNSHPNLVSVRLAGLPTNAWQFFYNCPKLSNLIIDNTDDCKIADHIFYNCFALTQPIYLNNATNMWMTYMGCSSLTNCYCGPLVVNFALAYCNCISIPEANIGPNVINMQGTFIGCSHISRNIVFNSSRVNDIRQSFEYSVLGYNYFVPAGSTTNDTIFAMQNDILNNYYVHCPEELQELMITWTIDDDNHCYYNSQIGLNVYYN